MRAWISLRQVKQASWVRWPSRVTRRAGRSAWR